MTQRSAFVSTLLLVLLGAVMSYKIPILKPSVTPSSSSMKTLRKDLAAKIVIGMFVVMPIDKAVDFMPVTPHVAVADSTGKMSTKLTARRRYLPRIMKGVYEFNGLAKDSSAPKISAFVADSFPGFKRALGLYGASLRKGEYPDEMSRMAEKYTESFTKSIEDLGKLKDAKKIEAQLKVCRDNLDQYLAFAKLPVSSEPDYATLPAVPEK